MIDKYSAPYYEVFDTVDNSLSNQRFDMGFIPYPVYYDYLYEQLGKKIA